MKIGSRDKESIKVLRDLTYNCFSPGKRKGEGAEEAAKKLSSLPFTAWERKMRSVN